MSPKKAKPALPPTPPEQQPPAPAPLPDMPPKPQSKAEAVAAAHAQEMETELHTIYDEAGPAKSDMTRLVQVRHSTLKKVLVGLMAFFAILATIAWAGVFFFSPGSGKFSGEGVELVVEGPAEVKSGELVTYALRYKNGERIALGTASLELRLPRAFKVQSVEPAAEEGGTWRIGSIAPDKDGLITLRGVFIAPIDREYDMQAILTYRPADFNSEFQKVTTKGLKITGSVIDLAVTGPSKVLPGDKVTMKLAYKNSSENGFEQLKLRAEWPQTFIPEKSEPASIDGDFKEWDVAALDGGGEGSVTVTGTFASEAEGPQEAKATIGFLGEGDAFETQKESTFSPDVLRGDFVTALILNGKSDAQPVRFGDVLRFAVTYKNTGTVTLGDVRLALTVEATPAGKVVLWNDLKDKAKGLRDGNVITWTKRQVPSLGTIEAGEEGILDLEVPVLDKPLAGVPADAEYAITSWLEATVGTIDGETVDRAAKTSPIVAKLVSDTVLAAEARYFNEDSIPVGSGPLPPKVGEATAYRVSWKVTNSLHELSDLKISARLPANVRWTGLSNVDAGDLRFDAAAEKMIWTLNWMPTSIRDLTVSFDVAITPSEDQRGRIPTLVDGAIFEAIDKRNGWPIILSAQPLTTGAENDELAAGKGRVE